MKSNDPKMPGKFWDLAPKRTDTTCRLWTGAKISSGYGAIRIDDETWLAHRYAFFLTYGQEPKVVEHLCNTRLCIEPEHLVGGTIKSNNRHMWQDVVRCKYGHVLDGIINSKRGTYRYCK